jgi:opacity protein-like surface antigen
MMRGGYKDVPDVFSIPGTIVQSNNQIGVQFVATDFNYKEKLDGFPFDTEKGWVPGAGVSFSLMRNWFVDNLYVDARFAWENGKTEYLGAYQGYPYGSLISGSGATVYDYDLRFGKGFAPQPDVMATPYFGVGYHDWDRMVNAGENYSHAYAGGGLLVQWSCMSRFVLSVDGFVGATIDPQIKVATIPGEIVGSTLALGSAAIFKVGASGDYAITRRLHVSAGVEWVTFDYGESPLDPTGNYLEPYSHTSNVTVKAGVGYAFGNDFVPLK